MVNDSSNFAVTIINCKFDGYNKDGSGPIIYEGEGLIRKVVGVKLDGWACYGPGQNDKYRNLIDAARESLRMHYQVTGGVDYGYISPKLQAAVDAFDEENQ